MLFTTIKSTGTNEQQNVRDKNQTTLTLTLILMLIIPCEKCFSR